MEDFWAELLGETNDQPWPPQRPTQRPRPYELDYVPHDRVVDG